VVFHPRRIVVLIDVALGVMSLFYDDWLRLDARVEDLDFAIKKRAGE